MTFRDRATDTAAAIFELLKTTPSAEQSDSAIHTIEQAIIEAYQDAATQFCTAAEAYDPKHGPKLADEIRRANTALIANLSSMR